MQQSRYGDIYAEVYDALFNDRDDLDLVCDRLGALAGSGDVLEFGVGTGRVALPLARRGFRVVGIDNSEAMLERLYEKLNGERVETFVGDCSTLEVPGKFSLVYIAFSTIYLLTEQEAQVMCFQNAARHLKPGGYFVVETFVHDRTRWLHLQETVTTDIGEDGVTLRVGKLDPVQQIISMQQVGLTAEGISLRPNRLRFIYPSEMDLMARLAGMELQQRWGGWDCSPFTASSGTQIAVYQKVASLGG